MADNSNPFDQFDAQGAAVSAQGVPAASGNPFDQFDAASAPAPSPTAVAPSSTPFGQAVQQQVQIARAQDAAAGPAPTPGPLDTALQSVQDYGNAAAHHLANIPVGALQLGANAASKIADALLPATSQERQLDDAAAQRINQNVAQREAQYQATTPTNKSSIAGATTSEILPWMLGIGEAKAAGYIPEATTYLGKIGQGILEGGGIAAAQPVSQQVGSGSPKLSDLITGQAPLPTYWDQKLKQIGIGAATGGTIPAAGGALSALGSGVKNVVQHVTNPQAVADANIARLFGTDPSTISSLENPTQYFPGEQVSAAEAVPSPQSVAAERLLRNNPTTAPIMAQQDIANNAQRLNQVQSVAGTPADVALSKGDRSAVVQPWIDANLTDSRPVVRWSNAAQPFADALSKNMIRGPDFQALKAAQGVVGKVTSGAMQEDDGLDALKELGDSVSQKYAPVFQQATDAINKNMVNPTGVLRTLATIRNGPLGLATDNMTGSNIGSQLDNLASSISKSTNINGLIGTDMLDAARQNASRMLGNASSKGQVALGPVNDSLVNAIDKVAPGYKNYLQNYALMSQPLNTMDAVSPLLDPNKVNSLNAAGQPNLTATRLNQVLRANEDAPYQMSPNAQQTLENLRDSLTRRSIVDNKIAASGPGTAADLNAANFTANSPLASAVFGSNLGRSGGWLGRGTGALVGGGLGALMGGPVGALAGAGIGGATTDALGAANRAVLAHIAETATSSRAAAEAIRRYNALGQAANRGTPVTNALGITASRYATLPAPQTSQQQ